MSQADRYYLIFTLNFLKKNVYIYIYIYLFIYLSNYIKTIIQTYLIFFLYN